MIKRISILVRRPQDEREAFSRHWSRPLVAQLPAIRSYVQNHVADDFPAVASGDGGPGAYDIDGFVELYFADHAAMRGAFSGPDAQPIWVDEPNFLGHSTAYAINGDRRPNPYTTDAKLVIVAAASLAGIDWLESNVRKLETARTVERNDVGKIVPRTTMARGPQPADVFLQVLFADVEATREAGRRLATVDLAHATSHGIERLAITRVQEERVV